MNSIGQQLQSVITSIFGRHRYSPKLWIHWLMTTLLIVQPALAPLGQTPVLRSTATIVRSDTPLKGAKKVINPVPVVVVPAASFELLPVAPDSIASAFGTSLANQTLPAPGLPLPTSLGNTVVIIRDSKGIERIAPEFFISPGQINFLVPADTASGTATITVVSGDGTNSEGTVQINAVVPAVFTASQDGKGVLAANAIRVKASGAQNYEPVFLFDAVTKRYFTRPLDLGPEGEHVFMEIYVSGIRRAPDPNNDGNANETVRVVLGGTSLVPQYVGRHSTFVGLDQINIEIPRTLIGRGRVNLAISGTGFPTSNLGEIELAGTQSNVSPMITGFSANTVLAGQSLTINGISFAPNPSDNIVHFGNAEASVISATPTQLGVIVPFGAESGAVKIQTPQGSSVSLTALTVRTSLSGIVQDSKRQPLSGVAVKLTGTTLSATTNAEGGFLLPDVPAGAAQIEIDSSKTTNLYEKLKLRTTVIAGRDNPLGQPISAQAIAGPMVVFGANNNDGSGTNPQIVTLDSAVGKATLEVQPSTFATFPDGTTRGNLTLTAIENSRVPVALPTGIFSKAMVQVSPFGTTLSVGAKLTFPNADGYGAGASMKLFRWEQKDASDKLGNFIEAGTATVSTDGQRIETAANAITEAGIYFAAQPQTTTTVLGRVVESDGTAPVRRVVVQAHGQSAITDGNGGFILRNLSAKSGEAITLDVTYLRPNNRVEKVQRANVIVNINNLTTIAPDIVLSASNTNRPPAIYAPSVLTVAAGGSLDTNLSVIDPDGNQTVQVNLSGVPFATLSNNGNGAYTLKLAPAADAIGNYSLTITATDNQNATTTQTIAITVLPSGPTIADFNPKSGAVGVTVILTGSTLKAGTSDPVVTFTGNGNTRITAQVTFSSSTEVRAIVPNGAISGAIELTTAAGRARTFSIFTVSNTQDFALALAPANVTTPQGSSATYIVQITSAQANFTQLVKLSLTGLPANVSASFNPEQITAGATSTLTITVGGTVSIGSYTPIIRGNTIIDGADTVRTTQASLNVQSGTQTALAGRVLSTLNEPIIGATISLDNKSTQSDAAGSFLLTGVTAGQNRALMVDGRTASAPNRTYPVITEAANIVAGKVNVIPDTYYLPPIDVAHDVEINPTQDTIATTPMLTGYKLMVPAGAKIRNLDGSPITRMSITVLPIDRIPAPLPATATTAMVLTAQPGGAVSDVPLPVTYPNMMHSDPGTRVELYSFEHKSVQWVRYGFGRVSADGRIVEPEIDPTTGKPYGLRDFAWHFITPPKKPRKPKKCTDCLCALTKAPVDLTTGNKIETMTDISFGGARGGLELTRKHTTNLALGGEVGRFGRGMKDNYSIKLTGLFQEGGAGRLVPAEDSEGQLFSFTSGAATGGEMGFTTNETTGQIGDVLTKKAGGVFEYRTRNGEVTRFDSTGKMIAMIDRNGNTTTLIYSGANLTKITDAVGRSITFTYSGSKVSLATDPLGRNWQYAYDGNERLISVTDPLGDITKYANQGLN